MDDQAIIEFLRKSYTAVDGLWFLRVEGEYSYEEALDLDEQVWQIMPKIQARKAKQLLGVGGGSLVDLVACIRLKLVAEDYDFEIDESPGQAVIRVHSCPWLRLLRKADRMHVAIESCNRICSRDYAVWAMEISPCTEFRLTAKIPEGSPECVLTFVDP